MEEERCMIEEPYNHWQWNESGYLELTPQDRRFIQTILFHEYMEWSEVNSFHTGTRIFLQDTLQSGLDYHEDRENYDACQLFLDVLKRYQYDIEQFDK